MNRIGLLLCLAVIGVVAVTGCGGGGKSGGSSPSYDRLVVPRILNTAGAIQGAATALHGAAEVTPVAGSVNQSSDATNDEFQVMVSGPAKTLTIEVYNTDPTADGEMPLVTTGRGRQAQNLWRLATSPEGTELYERLRGKGWRGAEFYRHLEADDLISGSPAGQLWVDLYTDYEGEDDTDYLAGGIWVFVPETATAVDEYEFGAFVDGNDPFSENPTDLTGTATYEGDATGVYSVQEDSRNFFFDALVELTADFDANDIEGRIHTFTVDGDPVEVERVLMLQTATFANENSGFFRGDTEATWDGETYAGKWGGQFYGNDEADGKPGSVAGTFGATTGDPATGTEDAKSILGVFGAHRQME